MVYCVLECSVTQKGKKNDTSFKESEGEAYPSSRVRAQEEDYFLTKIMTDVL